MTARKLNICLMLIFLLVSTLSISTAAAQTKSRYFAATGYTMAGTFLDYWQSHGGVPQLGLPISRTYMERNDADGNTYCVQYLERSRLEYHPEQTDPEYRVMLGLVGLEAMRLRYPQGVSPPTNGDFSIMENDNDLLTYSFTHEILGLPVTAPFEETESDGNHYRVVYTEHDRLERHTDEGIILGLVGSEVYAHKQSSAAPACTPGF